MEQENLTVPERLLRGLVRGGWRAWVEEATIKEWERRRRICGLIADGLCVRDPAAAEALTDCLWGLHNNQAIYERYKDWLLAQFELALMDDNSQHGRQEVHLDCIDALREVAEKMALELEARETT